MEFYKIAYTFLRKSNVKVSRAYLRERLESHPDYPSLKALTDILDEFNVDNRVIKLLAKDDLESMYFPVLALYANDDSTELKILSKYPSESELLSFTGVVVVLEGKKKIKHEEHNSVYYKEKTERILFISLLFFGILFSLLKFSLVSNGFVLTYLILSYIGLSLSIATVLLDIGSSTLLSNLFCNIEEDSCRKVTNSRIGKFFGYFGLADFAVVYFLFLILITTFFDLIGLESLQSTLLMINAASFLLSLFLLGYQLSIRSWCKLCLGITTTIWLQALCLFYFVGYDNLNVSLKIGEILNLFLFIVISSVWLIVKPLVSLKMTNTHQAIRIRKWRQDPEWFHALLPLHRTVDLELWEQEICYGNRDGILQIMVISSPFCEYCAKAHFELDKIFQKYSSDIGVRVRLTLKSIDPESENYKAIYKIFSEVDFNVWSKGELFSEYSKDILNYWFKNKNSAIINGEIDFYDAKHLKDESIKKLIKRNVDWCTLMGVYQTPAFFINGYEMPNPHTFKDFFFFAEDYIEILKKERAT